jgi:hypothetical protein
MARIKSVKKKDPVADMEEPPCPVLPFLVKSHALSESIDNSK